MRSFILFLCTVIITCQTYSQKSNEPNAIYVIPDEYSSIHHEGERALLAMKFSEALRHFKKVLRKFPDFPPALRSAGACYELMGDFETAKKYYVDALVSNPLFSRAMYFEVGNMHYKSGEYKTALEFFDSFDSLLQVESNQFTYNGIEEKNIEAEYIEKLEGSRRACHVALDSVQYWNITGVTNIGSGVNTKGDEYFPFLSNDGATIYYTSNKNRFLDEDLMMSKNNEGKWGRGNQVAGFNTKENEGMTTFVKDGRTIIFTACQRETVKGTCDIWSGNWHDGEISDPQSLKGQANSISWESQASINCDGSRLYFASNREGGQGGTDIWMSQRREDGSWGEPTNLGKTVNTPYDEEAPFITNDGKVLYFSSTGHIGLGEQDLFMSRLIGDTSWSVPVNLGMPVNSAYRELGFFLSADGKTGYFASDRKGGFGGMDIYHFEIPDVLTSEDITYVEGIVRDSITRLPVKATVELVGRQVLQTDDDGRFFLCVKAGDSLNIGILHKSYHQFKANVGIPKWSNETFYSLDLLLDPLFKLPVYQPKFDENATFTSLNPKADKTVTHNVLFDFDNSELKVESIKSLEVFLEKVFEEMEVVDVQVIGFADTTGSDKYNHELSEQRAKEVGVFLKEKGIEVSKVYIEGKGETSNNLPAWQNRKVEVLVYLAR